MATATATMVDANGPERNSQCGRRSTSTSSSSPKILLKIGTGLSVPANGVRFGERAPQTGPLSFRSQPTHDFERPVAAAHARTERPSTSTR